MKIIGQKRMYQKRKNMQEEEPGSVDSLTSSNNSSTASAGFS